MIVTRQMVDLVSVSVPTLVLMNHITPGDIGTTAPIATETELVTAAKLVLVIEDIIIAIGELVAGLTTVMEVIAIIPMMTEDTVLEALVIQPATARGGPTIEKVTEVTEEMVRMRMID